MGCQKAQPAQIHLNSQLPHLVVVVLAVENVPLLGTFEDDLPLRCNFEPRRGVDARFMGEQRFKRLARFLADGVAVLVESYLVDLGQRIRHCVCQLVELIAADPHSTALYFFASSVFTFLNISAYCAPLLRISSEYASRITRTSSLMRSSRESSSTSAVLTRSSVTFTLPVVISLASTRCLTVRRARYPI